MAGDWYIEGREKLLQELGEIADDAMYPKEIAEAIYSHLVNIGLIDYDIEKEVLWEVYINDTEE